MLWEDVTITVTATDNTESWVFGFGDGFISLHGYRQYRQSPIVHGRPDNQWDSYGYGRSYPGWLKQPPEVPADVVNRVRQVLIDRVNSASVVVGTH